MEDMTRWLVRATDLKNAIHDGMEIYRKLQDGGERQRVSDTVGKLRSQLLKVEAELASMDAKVWFQEVAKMVEE